MDEVQDRDKLNKRLKEQQSKLKVARDVQTQKLRIVQTKKEIRDTNKDIKRLTPSVRRSLSQYALVGTKTLGKFAFKGALRGTKEVGKLAFGKPKRKTTPKGKPKQLRNGQTLYYTNMKDALADKRELTKEGIDSRLTISKGTISLKIRGKMKLKGTKTSKKRISRFRV